LAWLDRGVIAVARTQVARRGVRPHLGLEEPRVITIGIDPHKSSHTAVALDETGAALGELRVPADNSTLATLSAWSARWPQRRWAIEGAGGLGRLLAQRLVAAGETVVDVPSALAARARVLQRGHGRKSDGIDARSVAMTPGGPHVCTCSRD
jgi:transposase